MELFRACDAALRTTDVAEKLAVADALARALDDASLVIDRGFVALPVDAPGRPAEPVLVAPDRLATRGVGAPLGRAAMLHAIAHIEFNAIHLALDACHRFPGMPDAFHHDWARVATEEAKHFALVAEALARRGFRYGSFPAHDGLWDMARRTAADPLVRMALVPRVLEARGLDVTPGIRARFAKAGDTEAVAILDVILADEIGHVGVGNRWYRALCAERGLEPESTFTRLAAEHRAPRPQGPINRAARLAGGFTETELDALG
jgi:uncharacterized ferritin-like protein (DUF455 family)